jgi:hypothetical protein
MPVRPGAIETPAGTAAFLIMVRFRSPNQTGTG